MAKTFKINLDLDSNQIQNAELQSATLGNALDANSQKITSLAAPTAGGDAANKTYVDAIDLEAVRAVDNALSGDIDANSNSIVNLASPSAAGDAANKGYVDSITSDLAPRVNWQPDVLDIQTDNTLDPGATPSTGDRYILTDTGNLHANFGTITGVGDNDIVEYDGSDFVVKADVSSIGEGVFVFVSDEDDLYQYNGTAWVNRDSMFEYTAGAGVTKTGNEFSIGAGAISNAMLAGSIANAKLTNSSVTITAGDGLKTGGEVALGASVTLDINVSDFAGTGLEADGSENLRIAATAAGNGLTGGGSSALAVNVDDLTIGIATDALQVKDGGISSAKLAADAVTGAKVADDAINSEHIAAGALGTEHYAATSVTAAKLGSGTAVTYNADFVSGDFTGTSITYAAGTHGLGATKNIIVAVYEDGTPNKSVEVLHTVADNGDVVITADSGAFDGHVVMIAAK